MCCARPSSDGEREDLEILDADISIDVLELLNLQVLLTVLGL